MGRVNVDPRAPWQTACWIHRHMGVPTHSLKNLALDGQVRVKSDSHQWPFRFYSVEDVNRYVRRIKRSEHPDAARFRTVSTAGPPRRPKVRTAS